MATTTNLSTLRINYLTQAQFEAAVANNTIKADELYLTPAGNNITINLNGSDVNSPAFYAPTTSGTSGYILQSNGSGAAPTWLNVLPVAHGGTGASSFTANSIIMSGSTTTAALTTRAVTNNTSNTAITANTNIPTMNTIYYGLAVINNASQNRGVSIYAPTSAGTANQILVSAGGTSAPTWKATANGAAYATSENGALTFGTLPIAQGGTGATTAADALKNFLGTTAIGGTAKPIYWTGSAFAAISGSAGSAYVPVYLNAGTLTACSNPSMLTNLGSTTAASVFAASPRPGVTGTLPIANGGTGMTSNPSMLTNLGSTTAANVFQASPRPGVTGTLPTANGGTGQTSWTANKLTYSSSATSLASAAGLSYFTGSSTAATPATYTRLHINGSTYGNTAENMISGTAGLFSFGDGGPQITFDTNATPGGSQAGALIYTDHDTAATGASWHFVSNQSDWNVTSKRFHARTGISIGTNLPSTSYNLSVTGTTYLNGVTTTTNNINRTSASLGASWIASRDKAIINCDASDSTSSTAFSLARIKFADKTYAIGSERAGNNFGIYGWLNTRTENGFDWAFYIANDTYFHCNTRVYGAVWNDYAEYRHATTQEPGRCVKEVGDDTLELSTARLQLGCEIVSDTFGFAIGETEKAQTPIATSGRVLAYPYEDREEYRNHIGEPVCSGPNGTISIMTKDEIKEYPHCIIGTISAVPDYEEWGTENIKVNGRIWIRIR